MQTNLFTRVKIDNFDAIVAKARDILGIALGHNRYFMTELGHFNKHLSLRTDTIPRVFVVTTD
ncbi:hypothetical protein DN38_3295 [Vibrio cholerae]|nr:hypothetical protein DN38_3295 [Vibrio cholerae]